MLTTDITIEINDWADSFKDNAGALIGQLVQSLTNDNPTIIVQFRDSTIVIPAKD